MESKGPRVFFVAQLMFLDSKVAAFNPRFFRIAKIGVPHLAWSSGTSKKPKHGPPLKTKKDPNLVREEREEKQNLLWEAIPFLDSLGDPKKKSCKDLSSWWFFPTQLKNMQPSNWMKISPGFGVKIKNI